MPAITVDDITTLHASRDRSQRRHRAASGP